MILLLKRVSALLLTSVITVSNALDNAGTSFTEKCQDNITEANALQKLYNIQNYTPKELSQEDVKNYLSTILNLVACLRKDPPDQNDLTSFEIDVLGMNEKVVSTLVQKSLGFSDISFSVQNLEVQVILTQPQFQQISFYSSVPGKTDAHIDIDLDELSQMNDGFAAMALMTYTDMSDILKPSFFNTVTSATKTRVVSAVVSATLPKTSNTDLRKPVNVSLVHTTPLDPGAFLSCMDWKTNTWDTCSLTQTDSKMTVCSCNYTTRLVVISQTDPCSFNLTGQCAMDFLNQIWHNIAEDLLQETVKNYLSAIMNLTTRVKNQRNPNSYGNILMGVIEKLAAALVGKTGAHKSISISLQTLEVQVFAVGPEASLKETLQLTTSHASMDIDLTGIGKNNDGSAAVAFISYTNIADMLDDTFNTFTDTKKTIMSRVVSVTLPNTGNTELSGPVNFTLKHIQELAPENILSCMYWEKNRWVGNSCNITMTNSSHTVCSCNRLGTFTLVMQTDPCMGVLTGPCTMDFLSQIPYNIPQELPKEIVKNYLNIIMNLTTRVIDDVSDQKYLASYGDTVLNVKEKLVSTLVRKQDPDHVISLSLENTEALLVVEPNISWSIFPQLGTRYASVDIDLVEISKDNNGPTAVALMSYTDIVKILKPTLFETNTSTKKTMMSTMVSVSLPKTVNSTLTKALKMTFTHINEFHPEGILSCVSWKTDSWLVDGCSIEQTNSTHTVCSCDHLSTFALIMQTDPCMTDHLMNVLIAVAVIVGLVFLSLSIMTFALYSRNPVTNAALINLSINLLLFHLLSLIKTFSLTHIQPLPMRAVLAGVQWFLLMSIFVWMFIEAVLLYTFIKNLSQIRGSKQGEVLSWKWLIVVGYLIPLGVLGMSGARFPKGYIDEECWLKEDGRMIFIFSGPLLFTVTLNLVPYLATVVIMIFTLKQLNNEIFQRSISADKNLIMCILLRSLTQFVVLMCSWILLYIPSANGALYHAFQLLNSQQGTFIFLVHCLPNQEVRRKLRKLLCAFGLSSKAAVPSKSVKGQKEDSQEN